MSAHVVVAVAKAKAGHENELRSRIEGVAKASWEEPGVISYSVHDVQDEPGSYMMVEVYASDQAFQDHLDTEHVKALIADMPGMIEGELLVYQGKASSFASGPKGSLA